MNSYFKVIEDLKTSAIAEPFINTVTQGDIMEHDLNQTTIFPLCHLTIGNVEIEETSLSIDITILLMDITDHSKEAPSDDIRGNNNEMDVLNTQLAVANRLQASILRNSSFKDDYQLEGAFTCEPFTERFDNNLAGWAVSFSITIPNTMTSC